MGSFFQAAHLIIVSDKTAYVVSQNETVERSILVDGFGPLLRLALN